MCTLSVEFSRHGTFYVEGFVVECMGTRFERVLHAVRIAVCDEPEPSRLLRVRVHNNNFVDNFSILGEMVEKCVFSSASVQTTDKNLSHCLTLQSILLLLVIVALEDKILQLCWDRDRLKLEYA